MTQYDIACAEIDNRILKIVRNNTKKYIVLLEKYSEAVQSVEWIAFDINKNVANRKYVLFHVLRCRYDPCTDAQLMTSVKQIAIL